MPRSEADLQLEAKTLEQRRCEALCARADQAQGTRSLYLIWPLVKQAIREGWTPNRLESEIKKLDKKETV